MPAPPSSPVVTGLFIDLVNSTTLHRDPRLGRNQPARDRAFQERIKAPYDDAVAQTVREAGGWVVNPAGDGWCCALPEPQKAVECALVLQHRLKALLRRTPVGQVLARVGLHFASAGPDPQRYIHQAGNLAARVQAHAPDGGVAVTGAVRELCADGLTGVSFRSLGVKELKGVGNQGVFAVECSAQTAKKLSEDWREVANAKPLTPPAEAEPPLSAAGDEHRRRIDVAVPARAALRVPVVVLVQVRMPDSSTLGQAEGDWPFSKKPHHVATDSGESVLAFPVDPQTGRLLPAKLVIEIVAPDFEVRGHSMRTLEVPPKGDSPRLAFCLIPQKRGECAISVVIFTLGKELVGTIPTSTIVNGTDTQSLQKTTVLEVSVRVSGSDTALMPQVQIGPSASEPQPKRPPGPKPRAGVGTHVAIGEVDRELDATLPAPRVKASPRRERSQPDVAVNVGEVKGQVIGQQVIRGDAHFHQETAPPDARRVKAADLEAYLTSLIKDCAPLRLRAIDPRAATPGAQPLGLTSVYVDLNLDLRLPEGRSLAQHLEAAQRATRGLGRPILEEEALSREAKERQVPVPVLEALACHEKLVLLGAPGSGKSTVVAYVALALAEAALGNQAALERLGKWWTCGALLPVRVVLRQFAASLPPRLERGRASHLWDFIASDLEKSGLPAAATAVSRQIAAQSGALFLLDGLDEAREESTRTRILEAVEEFTRTAGGRCRFLLTARPYAWDQAGSVERVASEGSGSGGADKPRRAVPSELAGLPVAYRLADFEPGTTEHPGQIELFITRWYEAIQAAGWPVSEPARKVAELQQAVRRDDLKAIARNPLLLTLMATLHSNRAKLPEDRADLYNEVVELLLQRWNEVSGAERGLLDALNIPTLTLSHLRKVIQSLAFQVHEAHVGEPGVSDIPEGALLNSLRPLLQNDAAKADLTLRYIEERAGLLIGQGVKGLQRQYTFPHRTFQEFLAACHLAGRNDFCAVANRFARDNPAHWREVLILAARRAEADRGVPVADTLVHHLSFTEWSADHTSTEADWRAAALAAEQLLEIGLAAVAGDENHRVIRDRVAGWLAALLAHGALPVQERTRAGIALGKLGDPRPGVRLKNGLLDLEDFIPLPRGAFTLGETGRKVVIAQDYRISRYPVTVAQFEPFKAVGYDQTNPNAPGWWGIEGWKWKTENQITGPRDYDPVFQTPNHPRVGVSWYEAMAFCRWLTEQLGQTIALPSEAQWERAARCVAAKETNTGGDEFVDHPFRYPWRSDSESELAQRCNMRDTGLAHTSAVGLFPNGNAACGAADLSGNVWEWCENWSSDSRQFRVVRGGSWFTYYPANLSCSYRLSRHPENRYYGIGFRVVCGDGCSR